ncbi:MAG: tRNA (N(6)-L-threonylcarbamoyladenosine(37)-C(2))-methylthiotransferase [Candidatus Methanomethylicaceae archaeon]
MRIYIKTFGCSANKVESELIKKMLVDNGYEIVDSLLEAEVVIVNTCTVRSETDLKVINYLKSIKKKKIIVTGCMASSQPALIAKYFPSASIISLKCIPMILEAINKDKFICLDKELFINPIPYINGVKATILIARGCLGNCSYCIVKVAKGKLKSINPNIIIENLIKAIKLGVKEIRLSAQDTGVYGIDIGTNIASLLKSLTSIPGDFIIRLGMFKPSKIVNELISSYKSEKIYKFIHIPVQSGSNIILKKMNRGYTVEDFKEVVYSFRREFPNITLFTDIIVGFPEEEENDFEETCKLIIEIKPDKTHVARFSPRPHTLAASMPQISEEIKKKRSKILHEIIREIQLKKNEIWIGKEVKALVVDRYIKGGFIARTPEYKSIAIPNCNSSILGKWIEVVIDDITPFYLIGRTIHHIQEEEHRLLV